MSTPDTRAEQIKALAAGIAAISGRSRISVCAGNYNPKVCETCRAIESMRLSADRIEAGQ